MSDLLERMRMAAEDHAAVYEAYKAECDKAQELPEVWYLETGDKCGVYYPAGVDGGCQEGTEYWDSLTSKGVRSGSRVHTEGWTRGVRKVTAAEYNNAYALHHGADFTGRLQDIDVPVCELNQATRDEMFSLPMTSVDVFIEGIWCECGMSHDPVTVGDHLARWNRYDLTYRLRAPKTRPMTRKEVLAWAASVQAFGWVVTYCDGDSKLPQWYAYELGICDYQRAPIATLNDDGTGGEWEAFEVTV